MENEVKKENVNETENQGHNNNQENNIDDTIFEKLDAILDKRFNGLAKSVLKDNGVSDDDEVKELVSKYRENKAKKANEKNEELENLKNENSRLKSEILNGKLKTASAKVADDIGIDQKYIKQVMKLADLDNVVNDGVIDETKLHDAMAKVIEECEVFKKKDKNESEKGFKNIGASSSKENDEDDITDKIRRAMGLK